MIIVTLVYVPLSIMVPRFRNMHEKMKLLIAEQMEALFEIQQEQMKLMEEIRRSVNKEITLTG